jgi:hypothetical protein
LLTYDRLVTATIVGPYYYDGQVAVVTRRADGTLARLFVYGATFLIDQSTGETLAANLDGNAPFEASGITGPLYLPLVFRELQKGP